MSALNYLQEVGLALAGAAVLVSVCALALVVVAAVTIAVASMRSSSPEARAHARGLIADLTALASVLRGSLTRRGAGDGGRDVDRDEKSVATTGVGSR